MKLSPVEEYGLRCLLKLAKHYGELPVTIRMISESEGLSTAYVGKLMFLLHKANLVQATRGVQGGYVLIQKPSELTLDAVFKSLDPQEFDDLCEKFTGNEQLCVHLSSCAIKQVLGGLNSEIHSYLKKFTLADLIPQVQGAGHVQQHT
jgi:Rrf2 family iron-sulfur cluster assembly transcriptional regulator